MTLPESKPSDEDTPRVEPENTLSARLGAESALTEFQHKMVDHLTDEQAKDAYARLMVGRGFDRPKPAPVMTIHSAIVSGEGKAAEAEAPKADPVKSQGLTGFLRGLAERLRKRE